MLFLTQAQYIFIHDAIKHKLESLGYGHGVQSSAVAVDVGRGYGGDDFYQSMLRYFIILLNNENVDGNLV